VSLLARSETASAPGGHGHPVTHFYLVQDVIGPHQAWQVAKRQAEEHTEHVARGRMGVEECAHSIFMISRMPLGGRRWQEQHPDTPPPLMSSRSSTPRAVQQDRVRALADPVCVQPAIGRPVAV
jgi:hypothetical protein